jgi:hypothetical protein
MSCRIAIYLAAAAIGTSCIATEASARSGGGARGMGGPVAGAAKSGAGNKLPANQPSGSGTASVPRTITVGPGGPTGGGAGGPTGGGAAVGARYFAPASYDSNTACGRYPYPPCNRVPTR